MKISTDMIKELREQSGAGVMECRNALDEAACNMEQALAALKERGLLKAQKKAERETLQGLVEAYVHTGGRLGSLVEVNCETDFVARTDEFKELARALAMQVAAMSPQYIDACDIPEGEDADPEVDCLLQQAYIKDPARKVGELVVEAIAKMGENIRVRRIARFELGN
ncbi:elongation factor Ts [Chloroflexota bacterium]